MMSKPPVHKNTQNNLAYSDLSAYEKSLVEKALNSNAHESNSHRKHESQKADFHNKLSRRHLLKLMSVTGVSLATAQHLLTSGGEAVAQTPKKGGTVRYASNLHGPDDQLDPALFTSSIDYCRGRCTYIANTP